MMIFEKMGLCGDLDFFPAPLKKVEVKLEVVVSQNQIESNFVVDDDYSDKEIDVDEPNFDVLDQFYLLSLYSMNMSDTPSLIAGSSDTPGSIDIPLESSSSSSTIRRQPKWAMNQIHGRYLRSYTKKRMEVLLMPSRRTLMTSILSGFGEGPQADRVLCRQFTLTQVSITDSTIRLIWKSDQDSVFDHVAEERIKILEKKVSYMRENQERVFQERVELEVQQRVEQEVFRLRQQTDDRFKSMEEQWSRMMSDMPLFSRSFSNPTLPNRDSSNA
ncbi:hypothetical protein FXO38_13279 [Capsicum annuum]|nr:hypothetical protein FXO38_13279 [Capsicum annuum]